MVFEFLSFELSGWLAGFWRLRDGFDFDKYALDAFVDCWMNLVYGWLIWHRVWLDFCGLCVYFVGGCLSSSFGVPAMTVDLGTLLGSWLFS